MLLAAGAGAGLATAFNAPIAGAIFVLEELVRRFELRIAIAALGASATAISVSRAILGDGQDFHLGTLIAPGFRYGRSSSFSGRSPALWRSFTIACSCKRWRRRPPRSLPGRNPRRDDRRRRGSAGVVPPDLAGGGDPITQRTLSGAGTLALLPQIFLLRLGLGASPIRRGRRAGCSRPCWCSARNSDCSSDWPASSRFPASTFSRKALPWWGWPRCSPASSRAADRHRACHRMTADVTMLLPMLGACAMAMLTPTLFKDPPIYDLLRERTVSRERARFERVARE